MSVDKLDKEEIGSRILLIRLDAGETQKQFAKRLNASKGNVSSWENGKFMPNIERIKKIADFAGISVKELLYGNDHPEESDSSDDDK